MGQGASPGLETSLGGSVGHSLGESVGPRAKPQADDGRWPWQRILMSPDDVRQARMTILKEVQAKGIKTYLDDIGRVTEVARVVLNDENELRRDDLWDKRWPQKDLFWWRDASPAMRQLWAKFHQSKLLPSTRLGPVLRAALNGFVLQLLVQAPPSVPKQQVLLFRLVLKSYYHNATALWPVFLNIDHTFHSLQRAGTTGDTARNVMLAAVAGSGPMVLKVMQQLNSLATKEDRIGAMSVAELTSSVLAKVPGLSDEEFEFLRSSFALPEQTKNSISRKKLGGGSIAESRCAKWTDGSNVVVKYIKPMYIFYFLCEVDFFLHVTWKQIPKFVEREPDAERLVLQMRQMLLFLVREFAREFDYAQEALFTDIGHAIYNRPSAHVRSVKKIAYVEEPFPVLVLEEARGRPLESFITETEHRHVSSQVLSLVLEPVQKLLSIWMVELFFKSGFFHADLHAGNLLAPSIEQLEEHVRQGTKPDIWIIDFGSCGQLSHRMQCCLIKAVMIPRQAIDLSDCVPTRLWSDKGEGERQKPTLISRFFKNFDTLTPEQQAALNRNVNRPSIVKKHEHNLLVARRFVRAIWNVCDVTQDRGYEEELRLANAILDYSHPMDFGQAFLAIIKYSKNIGRCTSNATLMFGRATGFVARLIWSLQAKCTDLSQCPFWELSSALTSELKRSPQAVAKLALRCAKKRNKCED